MRFIGSATTRRTLPAVVWATAWVSFFADVSTELIYGVLPAYYLGTLALSIVWLGFIEGFAESVVSITKLFSGHLSDRSGRRKIWMLWGYGLSALSKPVLALVGSGAGVMAARSMDRLGKGVRGAPRDALVAASVEASDRGRAFGAQRALDHAGALTGGLIAAALIALGLAGPRDLFFIAIVPGALAVGVIAVFIHEPKRTANAAVDRRSFSLRQAWRSTNPDLKSYLLPAGVFALANSSDMLLLALCHQRFVEAGFSARVALGMLPLLWALLHVVRSVGSAWGGTLSDRVGRVRLLLLAQLVYAADYLLAVALALGGGVWLAWVIFGTYGLFTALAEAPQRALIADLQPIKEKRGAAFGLVHFVEGALAFPATLIAVALWKSVGPAAAFGVDAALALTAMAILGWVSSKWDRRGE